MITSENYVENVVRTDCEYNVELYERLLNCARILHASMGLVTEAGELLDMLKKHIFYGKPFDKVNGKEECGDASWYIGLAIDEMKTTMNEVLTMNIEKLKLRYPEKFSNEKAIDRDVEAERELLEKDFNSAEQERAIKCDNAKKEFIVGNYPDDNSAFKEIYLNYIDKEFIKGTSDVKNPKGMLNDNNIKMEEIIAKPDCFTIPIPPPKPLPLSLYTQYDAELKCEYIVVDGVRFIEEKRDKELLEKEIKHKVLYWQDITEPSIESVKSYDQCLSKILLPEGIKVKKNKNFFGIRMFNGEGHEIKLNDSIDAVEIKRFDKYSIDEFNNALQFTESKTYSQQALDWIKFAIKVITHIEEYAVPQYGDKGANEITDWTVEQVLKSVQKRIARYGRQSREGQQELDFLKMAHEVQIGYEKYLTVQDKLKDSKNWEN